MAAADRPAVTSCFHRPLSVPCSCTGCATAPRRGALLLGWARRGGAAAAAYAVPAGAAAGAVAPPVGCQAAQHHRRPATAISTAGYATQNLCHARRCEVRGASPGDAEMVRYPRTLSVLFCQDTYSCLARHASLTAQRGHHSTRRVPSIHNELFATEVVPVS